MIPFGAVQIAGVHDLDEALALAKAGIGFIGFPLGLRDGREDLGEAEAAAVVAALPRTVRAVLITYHDRAERICELAVRIGTPWVQLHHPVSTDELAAVRRRAPHLKLIRALVVRNGNTAELVDDIGATADLVDAYITDTFDPDTGRTGATGKPHDWRVSARLAQASPRPLILAGGLDPDNVREAIRTVRPDAVDAHTGVEGPDGRKDPARVRRFLAEARRAFGEIEHR